MCEKSKCRHQTEDLCSCPPIRKRGENPLVLLEPYGGQYDEYPVGARLYEHIRLGAACRQKAERYKKQ